jgi:hypothetical protein
MALQVEPYYEASNDIHGSYVNGQRVFARSRVVSCSFEADPDEKDDMSKGSVKISNKLLAIQVWWSRDIVDESRAARMEREVLKLCRDAHR